MEQKLDSERKVKAVIRGLQSLVQPTGKTREYSPIQESIAAMSEEIKKTIILPPQIAIIGKTGVGKSSTINELFTPNPLLPVDHVLPATIFIEVRELSLGKRGKLIVVDCPGLGDGHATDERNVSAYQDILSKSDVAVWIIKADDRTLGIDQAFVKRVLPTKLFERLIIGINQVDKIEPGEWIKKANLPSTQQEVSIARKEKIVKEKFIEIGIKPYAIVSFSAKKHYRLKKLFKAMVDACPIDRRPSLVNSKGDIKSFMSEADNDY